MALVEPLSQYSFLELVPEFNLYRFKVGTLVSVGKYGWAIIMKSPAVRPSFMCPNTFMATYATNIGYKPGPVLRRNSVYPNLQSNHKYLFTLGTINPNPEFVIPLLPNLVLCFHQEPGKRALFSYHKKGET